MPLSRASEWCWILGAYLMLHLSFAAFQPVNQRNDGLMYDGLYYFEMATQTPRQLPPQAPAPFVYRVGTPLVAASIAKSLDWVIASGFDRVNVMAGAMTVVLLTVWLGRHVTAAWTRVLVIIFFMVEPHSPMRFANYYPINVDPAALMFLVAGLVALDWLGERPSAGRALAVAILVAIGVAFRELVLVVGVMALATSRRPGAWAYAWWPLAAGTITFLAIRWWVVATPSDYSAFGEIQRWWRHKNAVHYGLAWFLVFGPLLTLVVFQARASARALLARPDWLVGLVLVGLAALFGGSDTERLLVFASPFVYLLMARALARSGIQPTSGVMAVMVLAQLISSRAFMALGGPPPPPSVVGTEWNRLAAELTWAASYDSLWTQFCGPGAIRFYLVWFGVLAAGIVAASRWAERQRAAESV